MNGYVGGNPLGAVDPLGLEVYRNNRKLGSSKDKGKYSIVSHTYLYTALDKDLINTFSWGNSYRKDNVGNWHKNHINDVEAGKVSIKNSTGVKLTKDDKLDKYIEKAMNELQETENNASKHTWSLFNNCKTDASRLFKKALDLYEESEGKDYDNLTREGEKYQKSWEEETKTESQKVIEDLKSNENKDRIYNNNYYKDYMKNNPNNNNMKEEHNYEPNINNNTNNNDSNDSTNKSNDSRGGETSGWTDNGDGTYTDPFDGSIRNK